MKKFLIWPALAATVGLTAAVLSAPAVQAAPVAAPQPAAAPTLEDVRAFVTPQVLDAAEARADELGIELSPVQAAVLGAINPDEHECAATPFSNWLTAQLTGWTTNDLLLLYASILTNMPGYASMVNAPDRHPSYGLHGEYTQRLTKTFTDLKGFWDIDARKIQMVPMHSSIMGNKAALVKTYRQLYNTDQATAEQFSQQYVDWYKSLVARFGPNLPVISANAFAFNPVGDPNPAIAALPRTIVMGDGVLQGFDWIQLGKVAPQAVLAHEFGHQVQFANGLDEASLTTPEATRRIELMADSFSGYFLGHAKGANLNRKQIRQFGEMSYNIGDCGFALVGHHGTPNQRLHSSEWGADLATDARNQRRILPSLNFMARFDAALPTLVAPDAPALLAAA
jgi:hypothetical protein